ncbi:MAG: CoA ester lyase [Gammaproteobacteria bacterium]|nr:CoA ester lyase [Gammaproteobacteria bacterium]MYF28293.1 CoA ester lyase [Gammaproteobacteria bacterium]MYK47283.1 CoA ester lyase [Gammaproteobacteria bacterium]
MTRLRRSLHFVPGGNDRMLAKALGSNADSLILDLEDAVTRDRKDDVRGVVTSWLAEADFGAKEKTVRMNPLDTPWGYADLEATMAMPPDAYVVPKPETVEGLNAIDAELSRLERLHGHPHRGVGLILIASETPLGALNVPTLPRCPRVQAMSWGAEDLSATLGVPGNRDDGGNYLPVYQHCRVVTLLSAAAAGIQPIDAVYVDYRDSDGLRAECVDGARLGFTGKISIHPNQIDVINAAFTPAAEHVAEALALIEAFDRAQADGRMAFTFNGRMVDAPHLSRARALVERARLIEGNA